MIDQYEWGFTPVWDEEKHLINARSESVHEKRTFRESFESRRCLILADGFYEWEGQRGTKQPYRIERIDDEPFAFAGLWQDYGNGKHHRQVTILTTDSNSVVEQIHDRMPVMLEPEEESIWLESDDQDDLQAIMDPFPDDLTDAYPISKAINNPSNDSAEVIEPVDIGDQSGLSEFS